MSEVSKYTGSIPPLHTIKDNDTRRVLEAIVNGWRTRNGETKPDSDERFITKGELEKLVQDVNSGYFAPGGAGYDLITNPPDGVTTGVQKYVNDLLNQTTLDILNNRLWTVLGQRIPIIDIPNLFTRVGTTETIVRNEIEERKTADTAIVTQVDAIGARVGTTEAGILTEQTVRTNSDNALASAINTIWGAVGSASALVQGGSEVVVNSNAGSAVNWNQVQSAIRDPLTGEVINTAAVRQESKTFADKVTSRLSAEYTVKLETGGWVSGFGLISDTNLNSGATSSAFIIRADKFAIGSPSFGGASTAKVPFKVYTTPTVAPDGKTTIPVGVYMDTAFIGDGTIGTAKIGQAQIDTLRLAGESVTITRSLGAGSDAAPYYWTQEETIISYQDVTVPNLGTFVEGGVTKYYKQKFAVTGLQNIYPVPGYSSSPAVSWILRVSCINNNEFYSNWNAGQTYNINDVVQHNVKYKISASGTATTSFRKIFRSKVNGNTFPPTDPVYWTDTTALAEAGVSVGGGGTFTGTIGYIELEPGSYRFAFGVFFDVITGGSTRNGLNTTLNALLQAAKR
jgi:hypothetical protein